MKKNIHKKSLYYSLKENKKKVKTATKKLLVASIVLCVLVVLLLFLPVSKIATIGLLLFIGYVLYVCYTIYTLWQTRLQIKTKLKTL